MSEFVVESQGCCFLCLNKIENNLDPCPTPCHQNQSSTNYSLQHLSRYLGLDMGKVFYEGSSTIPSHLISKVRKSKLKVRLCNGCAYLNSRFSELHHQLQKIEMEVIYNLSSIHQKLRTVGETGLCSKLVSVCESVEGLNEKLKIADVIRNETLHKCSLKLKEAHPRVKLARLTSQEITRHKKLLRISRAPNNQDYPSIPILESGHMKKEPISDSDSSYGDFEGIDDGEFQSTNFSPDEDKEDKVDLKFDINQSVRNASRSNRNMDSGFEVNGTKSKIKPPFKLRHDTDGIRMRKRNKCDKCNKSFSRRHSLRRHQISIHLGHVFKCDKDKCNKSFSQQINLRRHQITEHFGQRFSCRFCNKSFSQAGYRNLHMRTRCPKMKKKIPK